MATYDFKFMFKPLCVVQSLLTSLLSQSLETTSLVISWWICLLRTVRGFAFEDTSCEQTHTRWPAASCFPQ